MSVKKLHKEIQTLITASIRINCFKTVVEELVYNALDANSTSIAIRVNVEGNTIQVIDNGCGIPQKDFPLLGQRHATSKCVDLTTLKAVPNKYGFRGQFMSSLIQVSRSVKITSRAKDCEQTFAKCFDGGKETDFSETTRRPSIGTTVEVKGFLYNMNIRKKSIDALQELRDIKTFLEQLSLVHRNISISLRDDSNNDIIFKLHKNRDIYQTLSTLFEVEKADLQELIVEKNQYKVVAYIGKIDRDMSSKHLIYINRKLTHNSNIYKKVNDQLVKTLNLKLQTGRKVKSKAVFYDQENVPSDGRIPFYVILITCPYYDYDISNTPKHSMLEFKSWEPVNKLLEKLVKFYAGDLKVKEVINQNIPKPKEDVIDETRDKVRKIVEKMLGNTIRKPEVSQMRHGVKGKLIKRKRKKLNSVTEKDNALSQIIPQKKHKSDHNLKENINHENHAIDRNDNSIPVFTTPPSSPFKSKTSKTKKVSNKVIKKKGKLRIKVVSPDIKTKTDNKMIKPLITNKSNLNEKTKNEEHTEFAIKNTKISKNKIINQEEIIPPKKITDTKNRNPTTDNGNVEIDKSVSTHDPILEKFEKQTESVKKKCELLAKNVDDLLNHRKQSNHEVLLNETVQYSNFVHKNHSVSVRQKIGEYTVQELAMQPSDQSPCTFDNRNWKVKQKNDRTTTYDLLHTILTCQTRDKEHEYYHKHQPIDTCYYKKKLDHSTYFVMPKNSLSKANLKKYEEMGQVSSCFGRMKTKLTYESHHYDQVENGHTENTDADINNVRDRNRNFITTHSREYFESTHTKRDLGHNFKIGFRKRFRFPYSKQRSLINLIKQNGTSAWNHQMESSYYTIEFSKSKENTAQNHYTNDDSDVTQLGSPRSLHEDVSSDCEQYATYTIIEQSNTYDNNQKDLDFGEAHTSTSRISHQIQLNYQSHTTNFEEYRGSYKTYCDQNRKYFKANGQVCKSHNNSQYGDDETALGLSKNNNCKEVEKELETREGNVRENSIMVISKTQDEENAVHQEIDPLDVCVTVHSQTQFDENPFEENRCNDSLFNDEIDLESFLFDRNIYEYILTSSTFNRAIETCKVKDDVTHTNWTHVAKDQQENNEQHVDTNVPKNDIAKETEPTNNTELKSKENERHDFNFRNRPRFVPKGLSPIFENCQTKGICRYTFDKDQFEESLYNEFLNNVQANTEIFEPRIQNVNELTTRDIEKVNSRLTKDNASLIFDGESLKNILVLGQVDLKFIAAKIKAKGKQGCLNVNESLVLFDQHAVHERIKLEQNMSDYFDGRQWKSIALDEVTVKLSKDDLVYLHNYRDKFMQFGLQWTFTDRYEVTITAAPEALLGKNPRQVEVIVKAIKNLIAEEISAIKSQKGCITLYPKSIMDLVFSEACRYAIKFGDSLSKTQCEELIYFLSECKTPFQCAHGRPVMAVLIDIHKAKREYTVNSSKIQQFSRAMKK